MQHYFFENVPSFEVFKPKQLNTSIISGRKDDDKDHGSITFTALFLCRLRDLPGRYPLSGHVSEG